jgi:hypothetical protein
MWRIQSVVSLKLEVTKEALNIAEHTSESKGSIVIVIRILPKDNTKICGIIPEINSNVELNFIQYILLLYEHCESFSC